MTASLGHPPKLGTTVLVWFAAAYFLQLGTSLLIVGAPDSPVDPTARGALTLIGGTALFICLIANLTTIQTRLLATMGMLPQVWIAGLLLNAGNATGTAVVGLLALGGVAALWRVEDEHAPIPDALGLVLGFVHCAVGARILGDSVFAATYINAVGLPAWVIGGAFVVTGVAVMLTTVLRRSRRIRWPVHLAAGGLLGVVGLIVAAHNGPSALGLSVPTLLRALVLATLPWLELRLVRLDRFSLQTRLVVLFGLVGTLTLATFVPLVLGLAAALGSTVGPPLRALIAAMVLPVQLVIAFGGFLLARWLTRPFSALLDAVLERAAGHRRPTFQPASGFSEIHTLARAVERMTDRLDSEILRAEAGEAALLEAKELSGIGAMVSNHALNTMELDAEARRILGIDAPVITREAYHNLIHPDHRAEQVAEIEAAWQAPKPEPRTAPDLRIVTPDGTEKWLRRHVRWSMEGEGAQRRAVLALVTIQDITQQRTLEESLRDIENRLRLALDVGEVGICAYDTAADEADLDERAASMLGLAAGRIDGATLRERVPSEDAPEDRHVSGGSSLAEWLASEGEFRVVLPDGQLRWLHRRSTSVVPLDGSRSSEVLVTLRDVTARRRFEEAQQGFIAMASHELKNPLAALRGNAQLMLRRQAFDRDRTQAIVEQTRRLERLVRDLLDITVATTGRFSLMRAPADLMEITRQVVAERSLAAPEHRFSIRNRLPSVVGNWDADRVAQILDNLLSNAVKYSRAGSEIVVDVSTEPGECRVCVEDRGVGVSSAEQARIFERFYRTYPGAAEGLGLGLYVTRVLVEAHGGAIGVDSVPGQGSRFWFTLPWSPGLVTAREPPSEVLREARRGSGRVLVVDDDRLLRELIRDALATEGIAVETAATGAEATRALEQHRFDLLLLDLMLPDTTGERLALDLAHLGLREGLPILVISAAHGVQERAERLGAAGYLEKPFELDALIRAVSESLPNPSPEAAFA